jgi:hypothetical protein
VRIPQPGQALAHRAQHLSQAWTPHDGQTLSPTPRSFAAGPMRLPHRSQYGHDMPAAGRTGPGPLTRAIDADRAVRQNRSHLAGPHHSPHDNPTRREAPAGGVHARPRLRARPGERCLY